jgi:hypothetical protein
LAFLSAVLRQKHYAPAGVATCATCFDAGEGEAHDRQVFATTLDLGLVLGDFLDIDAVDRPGALDGMIDATGAPFCAVCAPRILSFAIALSGRGAPPECACHGLASVPDTRQIPALGFACGLVLGDEVKRCDVCQALARGVPAHGGLVP